MGDSSAMAVLQYAVEYLGIDNIIVAGHFGCGGVKTTFTSNNFGNLESWLHQIREIKYKFQDELNGDQSVDEPKLVKLNVQEQVHRIARTPFVEKAWKEGRNLKIFGVIYDISTGKLISAEEEIIGHQDQDLDEDETFYI